MKNDNNSDDLGFIKKLILIKIAVIAVVVIVTVLALNSI
jgi:hypothetical protein